eukprot:1148761-Pelagomonas_calceolata.AAC.2
MDCPQGGSVNCAPVLTEAYPWGKANHLPTGLCCGNVDMNHHSSIGSVQQLGYTIIFTAQQ